jgi:hypothetical protein
MHEEEVAVAVFGMLFLFAFGWIMARYAYLAFKAWFDTSLKRDMVARGYAAQEIIAVVGTNRRCRSKAPLMDVPPAKPIRQPAYQ